MVEGCGFMGSACLGEYWCQVYSANSASGIGKLWNIEHSGSSVCSRTGSVARGLAWSFQHLLPTLRSPLQATYSLHCSSFLGSPFRILIIYLVKPKKGTTMETIGKALMCLNAKLLLRVYVHAIALETKWPLITTGALPLYYESYMVHEPEPFFGLITPLIITRLGFRV